MADLTPTDFQAEVREDLLGRLRRAEGQLRGIQKMVQDGRGCQEILIQLAAVKAAVVQAAMTILSTQLAHCVTGQPEAGRDDREALDRFMEIFKKFS